MEMTEAAYDDLVTLVSFGDRFHGGDGIHRAADWLERQLTAAGATVTREAVELPGWQPGNQWFSRCIAPVVRELPSWPMLWSGNSHGVVRGRVRRLGPQGLWGDSMTWERFAVIGDDGNVAAYLHGRDVGPAAPQPLPSGSNLDVAHLAIGHWDAVQLSEWLADEQEVVVELACSSEHIGTAVADNLIVDIPGTDPDAPVVLLCGHYDTFYNTVGAYDNGSGTVALLHLAQRLLRAPSKRSVRIVFFTAEEWHLGGARAYAATTDLSRVAMLVNIDGLGRGDKLEAFAAPERFDADARAAICSYAAESGRVLEIVSRFPPPTGTDDAVFYRAGVPSLFMTFNDLHRLHQPEDLPNEHVAANISWAVGLVGRLIDELALPRREPAPEIL